MATGEGFIPDEYKYVDCRLDRHSWHRPDIIEPRVRPDYGYPVYRKCPLCGSWWVRAYDLDQRTLVSNRRWYPEQLDKAAEPYLLPGTGFNVEYKKAWMTRRLIEREGSKFIGGT